MLDDLQLKIHETDEGLIEEKVYFVKEKEFQLTHFLSIYFSGWNLGQSLQLETEQRRKQWIETAVPRKRR